MKPLDWRGVLTEHGVRFVDRGPNVKRGEINIQCPFCGSADPSHHMGLSLESGFWACWRNSEHRGKSPLRLLTKLLGISYGRARQIAGMTDHEPPDPDGFDAVAARVMGRDSSITRTGQVRREFLSLPREFVPLRMTGASSRFFAYLRGRRFAVPEIEEMSTIYSLRAAITGDYKDRLILPYFMDKELVAWTGRAIAPAEVRYKDLPLDECLIPIKQTLFNYDALTVPRRQAALVVVEGPLDALKIDAYGWDIDVRAVALSTNSISSEQVYMLEEFAPMFSKVIVMLDNASTLGLVDSMRMKQTLQGVPNLAIMPVPYGLKDAAEMTPMQARDFTEDVIRRIDHRAL